MSKHPRDRGERRARLDKQKQKQSYKSFSDFMNRVQKNHDEKETIENDND